MTRIRLAESGWIPDPLLRLGIRHMLAGKLDELAAGGCEAAQARKQDFVDSMSESPIALETGSANSQHYEVPAAFFERVLGPRLKYSCGWWSEGVDDLATAEAHMLELTCRRAGLRDGMDVLDLGCGWGSASLWIAERYPASRILAVSNSKQQREFILGRCAERGLTNLEVVTADANRFDPERRFDRIVSVEMFEHLRNWGLMLERASTWLRPDGRLFLHVFCHRDAAYPYEVRGDGDWMARHFFTGGMMPSDDLVRHFSRNLEVERHWRVSGSHYAKTSDAWLRNLDDQWPELRAALETTHTPAQAELWLRRWRLFFLGCSELFGARGGQEWWVSHYRLAPTERS